MERKREMRNAKNAMARKGWIGLSGSGEGEPEGWALILLPLSAHLSPHAFSLPHHPRSPSPSSLSLIILSLSLTILSLSLTWVAGGLSDDRAMALSDDVTRMTWGT